MSDLIMQLAGVIQRDIDGLKDVAQNVANANTPGYRSSRAFSSIRLRQGAVAWSKGSIPYTWAPA